jgi:hypothetical protein
MRKTPKATPLAAQVAASFPLANLLLTPTVALDMRWLQQHLGAREPTDVERQHYDNAIGFLKTVETYARLPSRLLVVDSDDRDAHGIADTLILTSGLLKCDYDLPVLAYEIARLNAYNARINYVVLLGQGVALRSLCERYEQGKTPRPFSWVETHRSEQERPSL